MNSYRNIGIALLAGALLLAGFAGNALALPQTPACQSISNQASLTYTVGGGASFSQSSDNDNDATNGINATVFQVGSRVDVLVSTINSPKVLAANTDQALIFRVTNSGNDTQRYKLELYKGDNGDGTAPVTDDFDMTNIRVLIDTSADGSYDGDEVTAAYTTDGSGNLMVTAVTGGVPGDLIGGAALANAIDVIVLADTDATVSNYAIYSLKAISYQNDGTTLTEDTKDVPGVLNSCSQPVVEADGAATAVAVGGVTDAANDGNHYATGYYSAAKVTVQKGFCVISDPVNGTDATCTPGGIDPVAIPGAVVRYTLTLTNTGGAAASSLVLIDPIPGFTDFVVGSVTEDGAAPLTVTVSYSSNGGGSYLYVPGAGPLDAAVTHVSVAIPSLAANDGAAGGPDDIVIAFDVQIE